LHRFWFEIKNLLRSSRKDSKTCGPELCGTFARSISILEFHRSIHSMLHRQKRNCWTVPNGVRCISLQLSNSRKCTPNSWCNDSASYRTTSRPLHLVGPSGPKVLTITFPPGLTVRVTLECGPESRMFGICRIHLRKQRMRMNSVHNHLANADAHVMHAMQKARELMPLTDNGPYESR